MVAGAYRIYFFLISFCECRSKILIICYIFITFYSYLYFVVLSRIMSTRHKHIQSLFNNIYFL